jgi:hypothetical protein
LQDALKGGILGIFAKKKEETQNAPSSNQGGGGDQDILVQMISKMQEK